MRRLVKIIVFGIITLYLLVCYQVWNDKRTVNKYNKLIIKNTSIEQVDYLNIYGDKYIVLTDDNLYVFDKEYHELLNIDKILIHDNKNNYDIVYDDKLMYQECLEKENKIIYNYYDIYSYEFIKSVSLGGQGWMIK